MNREKNVSIWKSPAQLRAATTEARFRYLGRTLKDIDEAKLKRDFPGLQFEVSCNDEAGLDLIDYQLTFCQSGDRVQK